MRTFLPVTDDRNPTTNGQVVQLYAEDDGVWPYLSAAGFRGLILNLLNSQACTINFYIRRTSLEGWVLFDSQTLVASSASNPNKLNYNLAGILEFKLEAVNGAVAQATWLPVLEATDDLGASGAGC